MVQWYKRAPKKSTRKNIFCTFNKGELYPPFNEKKVSHLVLLKIFLILREWE